LRFAAIDPVRSLFDSSYNHARECLEHVSLGGMVGMVLTGVLARDVGLIWGQTATFKAHMIALVLVSVFSFVGSYVIFKAIDLVLPLRVTPEQEAIGLDLSQHGEFIELDPARQFSYSDR
jgi:ammonia channel protein AmtB